jgi:hypothetical protein
MWSRYGFASTMPLGKLSMAFMVEAAFREDRKAVTTLAAEPGAVRSAAEGRRRALCRCSDMGWSPPEAGLDKLRSFGPTFDEYCSFVSFGTSRETPR